MRAIVKAIFLSSCALVVILGLRMPASGSAAEHGVAIIPQPVSLTVTAGEFLLQPDTAILVDGGSQDAGDLLSQVLAPATGYALKIVEGKTERDNVIALGIDPGLRRLGAEGYALDVTPQRITIRAPGPAGAFYATQALRQLLPAAIYSSTLRKDVRWSIPCLRIEDYPRFAWRGALIDTARHFMPKEFLLKFIDLLALHKMNTLQLHLTDDQGWRIEITKYPRLTEIGSVRKQTRLGHERDRRGFDGKPHGGYYSQEDIREMVAYARRRHVNVVPEIEMPGHAQAAIAAYPELGNTAERPEVSTVWGVHKNIFNVREDTFRFLQNVLDEVLQLFPSKFIHVGGDEVPKDQWKASPEAQARIKELGLKDEAELQSWFISRMDQFLSSRGRRLVGWDEILEGGLAPGAVVMSWRGIEGGIAAAKAGHDVVMAPLTHTYFDYYQSKDPGEPLAIGGFISLDKTYSYEPVPPELSGEEAKHILGTQGQLWTEYIDSPGKLEYMAFPRLTALAEVAWTPAEKRDYEAFLKRLRVHESRFQSLDVNFRPVDLK